MRICLHNHLRLWEGAAAPGTLSPAMVQGHEHTAAQASHTRGTAQAPHAHMGGVSACVLVQAYMRVHLSTGDPDCFGHAPRAEAPS